MKECGFRSYRDCQKLFKCKFIHTSITDITEGVYVLHVDSRAGPHSVAVQCLDDGQVICHSEDVKYYISLIQFLANYDTCVDSSSMVMWRVDRCSRALTVEDNVDSYLLDLVAGAGERERIRDEPCIYANIQEYPPFIESRYL